MARGAGPPLRLLLLLLLQLLALPAGRGNRTGPGESRPGMRGGGGSEGVWGCSGRGVRGAGRRVGDAPGGARVGTEGYVWLLCLAGRGGFAARPGGRRDPVGQRRRLR